VLADLISSLLALAGAAPLLQAAAIVLGTFILEDAATVLAAMQVEAGGLSAGLALSSLYVGVVLGDLGLYGLGRLSRMVPWVRRMLPSPNMAAMRAWLEARVFQVVLVSRFLPGLRLPTYLTCGFLRASPGQFASAAVIATLCWTSLLFGISLKIGQLLIQHFGAWRWAGAAGFAAFVVVGVRLAATKLKSGNA
jgi:membrane protein DedA with SNARE-associated domain